MVVRAQTAQPSLIIVTGRAGSGKTTLAHTLARAVRCPTISRDEIKEGLVHATGEVGERSGDVQRHATDTFFDTLALLLARRITVVAEAAFQHRVWAPRLESLLEIARVRIVLCHTSPDLARARQIERGLADPGRARFHHDPAAPPGADWRELPIGGYDPPRLSVPTLEVDTSDGYQPTLESIVEFVRTVDAQP